MWKDTTGYSQGKERIPKAWTLHVGDLCITVLSNHLHYPGEWVMHCSPWFDTHVIGIPKETSTADAQIAALELVRKKVAALYKAIQAV